jgi:hypothetical protein
VEVVLEVHVDASLVLSLVEGLELYLLGVGVGYEHLGVAEGLAVGGSGGERGEE